MEYDFIPARTGRSKGSGLIFALPRQADNAGVAGSQ